VKAPSAPTLPKCRDCGGPNPRVVSQRVILGVTVIDGAPNQVESTTHEWLCASCEYKRAHLDAAPSVPLPRERSQPVQTERLFGA
jgi:hypothetical protein